MNADGIHLGKSLFMGRGVFASKKFIPGDIIEIVPVIVVPQEETDSIRATVVDVYIYKWNHDHLGRAIALGYGSLYNHSYKPNAKYLKNYSDSIIVFVCIDNIEDNEEIFINYNGDPEDMTPIVFEGTTWKKLLS